MERRKDMKLWAVSTFIALIFSLFTINPVIADDSPPPPVATEEVPVLPTVEASDPVEDGELSFSGNLPLEEENIPASSLSLPEVLAKFPEDTIVVAAVNDQIEPLVTQAAETAIVMGDPIWCPQGVQPIANLNGCTASYPDLYSLINDIDNSIIPAPAGPGVIWIMDGADASSSTVSIDGSNFLTWSPFQITLQGGWDGGAAGTIVGTSVFSVPLSIVDWTGSVTVNQISISGAAGSGLEIGTSSSITLEDVTSSGNTGSGAELYSSSAVTLMGGNYFNNNNNSGLYIEADGDILIENLSASNNGADGTGSGAELYSPGEVSITGNNIFNGNSDDGLYIEANSDINLENITANANGTGAAPGSGVELYSLADVNLDGVNVFNGNDGSGLYVESTNAINLENITAEGNDGNGAELYSTEASLTGVNVFNNNNSSGLYIEANGDLFAETLTASNNGGNGAELYSLGNFNLAGTNIFNGNNDSGLYVESLGNIDISNVTAQNNGIGGVYGDGAELHALGSISVTGLNIFNNNFSNGLSIEAIGNVYVENINAYNNAGAGIVLETNASASITCGILSGNASYAIEADLPGALTLEGVDFGGDLNDLSIDNGSLELFSNGCFTYPTDNNGPESEILPDLTIKSVAELKDVDGQTVPLDCNLFRGASLTLSNGDGAYIPCPIQDSARLISVPEESLPGALPSDKHFISGFVLSIFKDGQLVGTQDNPALVEYAESEAVYWDGLKWSTFDGDTNPFMTIFFLNTAGGNINNLSILYWDGNVWVELTNDLYLKGAQVVRQGGHATGSYFGATLNFVGTFALVEN